VTPERVVAAARVEIRRRWRDRGELWLTGPDWNLVRADYSCGACGAHVLDESYRLGHASEGRGGGGWWEQVCRACYIAAGHTASSPPRRSEADRALIWGE